MFRGETANSLKRTAMFLAYPVHVIKMNVTVRDWLWFVETGLMSVGFRF